MDGPSLLSDITIFSKYARHQESKQRREDYSELTGRNLMMHIEKHPSMAAEISWAYQFVYDGKVIPSMRSFQFAGPAIIKSPNRIYNCLDRDTQFITKQGVKSFHDFVDGDSVEVLAPSGEWRQATVRSYGTQKLYEITLKRGKTTKKVRATKDHRWLLRDGSETTSLSVGDKLLPPPTKEFNYEEANPEERLYWAYGYVYGDGTCLKNKEGKYQYSMVRLCGHDAMQYKSRFEELGFKTSSSNSLKGDYMAYTGTYLKTAPCPKTDSPELIKAFVYGYLDADGHRNPDWYNNRELSKYKGIQSSDKNHIEFIRDCFQIAGVYLLTKTDLSGQKTNYGTRPDTRKFSCTSVIGRTPQSSWTVTDIKESSDEVVWCLEVDVEKAFVLSGGIVTGNCCYAPVNNIHTFSEALFLLLGGTGVGYSVQFHHVRELPPVKKPTADKKRYLIGDSIEGWADSVRILCKAYFEGGHTPVFDFSDIRPKGARLITGGGKAPGPAPLKECLENLTRVLDEAVGRRLKPIEAHDMMCYIADAVLAGGIRRAALISLFSYDDFEMANSKAGNWWEKNPQRGRANNSVVMYRPRATKENFQRVWNAMVDSGAGEPGFYFTNNVDWGTNPCCEIALRPYQFCNLTSINAATIKDQKDLNERARAAAIIGTLQASYTDFHYLRPEWKYQTEKDALLGVSMTGLAREAFNEWDLIEAANVVTFENRKMAKALGINPAARTTCIKPEGSGSLVLGTTSGVHAGHSQYYIRRMRFGKNEAIYKYLEQEIPHCVETDQFNDSQGVVSIPVKLPDGAITRENESPFDLLARVKRLSEEWIGPGHITGDNTHNVSCTINAKPDQWDDLGEWAWENRDVYNGMSFLPYDGGSYVQAPFEEITKEKYEELAAKIPDIDLKNVHEAHDDTNLTGEIACAGGACEV